ncbi:hypothetical protein SAMN05661044_00697 [Olivibacter domesticus]|uniref:Uncharacterized protein n=1 Tax=Olivibacter domesticus TaxID=407022 RepID=A0A1H7IGI3_OLID1|nr:hypothetical protein SAMN05661044_00697 [Olivibacter domesticus]
MKKIRILLSIMAFFTGLGVVYSYKLRVEQTFFKPGANNICNVATVRALRTANCLIEPATTTRLHTTHLTTTCPVICVTASL